MLKNCLLSSSYDRHSNIKCGEIFCETQDAFFIHCDHCNLKLFNFEDFLEHFRVIHFAAFLHQKKTAVSTTSVNNGEPCDDDDDLDEKPISLLAPNEEAEAICVEDLNFKHLTEPKVEEEDNSEFNDSNENHQSSSNGDDDNGDNDCLLDQHANEDSRRKSKGTMKMYSCDQCKKSYSTERTLRIHIKMKHLKSKDYFCSECQEAFYEERTLKTHVKKTHTKYACSDCNRIYKSNVTLKVHKLTHKETKDIVCPHENCGKAFVSKRRLNVHMEVHTGIRKYVCEVCGYRSRSKHALEVHSRGHTGEKPFKCPNCDRYFASKSLVNEHQAMHSTERPHKCDICEATFARPKALYHHKHLHLKEKKFKCKICGLAYAQAAGLSAHMRQHKMDDVSKKTKVLDETYKDEYFSK